MLNCQPRRLRLNSLCLPALKINAIDDQFIPVSRMQKGTFSHFELHFCITCNYWTAVPLILCSFELTRTDPVAILATAVAVKK